MKNKKLFKIITFAYAILIAGSFYAKSLDNKKDNNNVKENISIEEVVKSTPIEANIVSEEANNVENSSNIIEKETNMPIFYDTNYMAYINNDSYVYGYYDFTKPIGIINKYQKVLVLRGNDEFSLVEYENGNFFYISNESIETLPELFVEVDLDSQNVKMYENYEEILSSPCTTGKNSTKTQECYDAVDWMASPFTLEGPGYSCPVSYWMPFNGGVGLHDYPYQDQTMFGTDYYKENGSHGCVRLPYDAAKSIYEKIDTDTYVLVHK